jgi:hypothetical protein
MLVLAAGKPAQRSVPAQLHFTGRKRFIVLYRVFRHFARDYRFLNVLSLSPAAILLRLLLRIVLANRRNSSKETNFAPSRWGGEKRAGILKRKVRFG